MGSKSPHTGHAECHFLQDSQYTIATDLVNFSWGEASIGGLACFRAIFFYLALAAIRCILHLKVQDSQGGRLSWACMFRYWLEIQPLNTLGFDLQDSVQDLDMIKGNWDLNQPFGCSGNSKPAGGVWDTQKPTVFIVHPIGVFRGMFVIHLGACCCSPSGFCCSRWMPVAFDAFTEIGADDKQPGHWAVMGAAAW